AVQKMRSISRRLSMLGVQFGQGQAEAWSIPETGSVKSQINHLSDLAAWRYFAGRRPWARLPSGCPP
ncbi:MAG TPA: hypothetical protein PLZ11_14130, partial [Thauera sp.]|nr:hypothetical protein [Thauera sp.]